MKHYLIDFENIFPSELELLEKFPDDATLHVFYSKNKPVIEMDLLERFNNANLRFYKIHKEAEKNQALDKQLLCFLGYLIGRDSKKEDSFCIVAKDKGYEDAIRFFDETCGVKVRLMWKMPKKNPASKTSEDPEGQQIKFEPYPDDTDLPPSTPPVRKSKRTRKKT